jgi:hypothetical protein
VPLALRSLSVHRARTRCGPAGVLREEVEQMPVYSRLGEEAAMPDAIRRFEDDAIREGKRRMSIRAEDTFARDNKIVRHR